MQSLVIKIKGIRVKQRQLGMAILIMSPPTSPKLNYWMSSSGTDSEGCRRRSEKTAFGQKQTKAFSVRESCYWEAEIALGIPCPCSRMFARMVPSTCPFYLHFRAHLSPRWTWMACTITLLRPFVWVMEGSQNVTGTWRALCRWTCTPGPCQTQPLGPHQDAEGKGRLLKRSRPTEKQTVRRKRNHGQHRLGGEIKTKELVTGYPKSISLLVPPFSCSLLRHICSSVPSQIHHS